MPLAACRNLQFSRVESESVNAESAKATFQIPESAPFFGDHFAKNPVFPGTLLMDTNLRFAETLASEISPANWKASGMSNVKLRAFMPPGESLDLLARVDEKSADSLTIFVETKRGKRRNSSARIHFQKCCLIFWHQPLINVQQQFRQTKSRDHRSGNGDSGGERCCRRHGPISRPGKAAAEFRSILMRAGSPPESVRR